MKHRIDYFLSRYKPWSHIEGFTQDQIQSIESNYNLELPLYFKIYLEKWGYNAYLGYEKLSKYSNQLNYLLKLTKNAINYYLEEFPECHLPKNLFFYREQCNSWPWYFFFCEPDNPDPPVYITDLDRWIKFNDNGFEYTLMAHRFSSFELEQHLRTDWFRIRDSHSFLQFGAHPPIQLQGNWRSGESGYMEGFLPPEIPLKIQSYDFYARRPGGRLSMGFKTLDALYHYGLMHEKTAVDFIQKMEQFSPQEQVVIKAYRQQNAAPHFFEKTTLNTPEYSGAFTNHGKTIIFRTINAAKVPEAIKNFDQLSIWTIAKAKGGLILPESVKELAHLEFLLIQDCDLESLPDTLGLFPNLKYLRIINNPNLRRLPDSICNLTQLEELRLEGNRLETLPEGIGQLKNLKSLICYKNFLTRLPDSIGKLDQLEELSVWQNKLTELPASLGKCINLYWLNAMSNCLRQVPASLADLPNLGHLLLTDNYLTELPEGYGGWPKLERMDVGMNDLTGLPAALRGRPEVITAGNPFSE